MSSGGRCSVQVHINSSFGFVEALRIEKGDVVSLVGAGGKTTTLYGIAGELRRHGMTVITTTTTNMQTPRYATTLPPLVYAAEEEDWLRTVRGRVDRYGSATVVGAAERDDKLRGLEPEQIRPLQDLADCVILEADGARGRSLKVPAAHEPVIPDVTSLTVVLAGLDVLGMPLEEHHVHRLDELVEITGADPGAPITEELIATALTKGYFPKIPRHSGRVFFLNKVDDSRLKSAENVGRLLISSGAPEVVFGQASQPNDCFYRMIPGIV
jgi:probable selenium-dependent hydroxylase accessory protein YqeC